MNYWVLCEIENDLKEVLLNDMCYYLGCRFIIMMRRKQIEIRTSVNVSFLNLNWPRLAGDMWIPDCEYKLKTKKKGGELLPCFNNGMFILVHVSRRMLSVLAVEENKITAVWSLN